MTFLTRLSLSNRTIVAVIAVALIALGIGVAPALKQQLFPSLSFPAVTVVATYRGASPAVVEDQVTKPIERAVDGVDGLQTITSTSQQGAATLQAQFDYGADVDDRKTAIQNAIAAIPSLPESVTTSVLAGSTDDQPTMTLAATSDGSLRTLAGALDDDVVPKIKDIDGVNDVTVSGERDQQIVITPDDDDLAANGLTASAISSAITGANGTNAAGAVDSDGRSLSVDVGGSLTTVQQLEDLWLSGTVTSTTRAPSAALSAGGGASQGAAAAASPTTTTTSKQVQLKDVATVRLQDAPATSITRTDGRPSLGLSITMTQDGSSATISTAVRDQLKDLQRALPAGGELTVVSDSGPSVSKSISGLLEEGLLGLVMAVLIILLFLRSLRSTLVTAVSIPLSLLIALIALWASDYSLNIFTLGGLTIAVGRVVDDSIVVLENIKRHLTYGEERRQAVVNGVREVAGAVTSSTLTTVSVFIPIALVSGIVGQLFGPFALTVVAAMVASLVVSLTVVPTLAFWFLKGSTKPDGMDEATFREETEQKEQHSILQRVYRPVLGWSLRFRKTVIGLAVLLLIATIAVAGQLKTSFLGEDEVTSLTISQTLPVGTDLATTNAAAQKVGAQIGKVDGVASYQAVVGGSGSPFGGAGKANTASYTVNLASGADADAVESALRRGIGTVQDRGDVVFGSGGFGGSSTIDVTLSAPSTTALRTATERVAGELEKVDAVTDVTSSLSADVAAISVHADGKAAAKAGLTDSSLTTFVAQAISGSTVTQVTIGGSSDDVVLKSGTTPTSLADISALKVTTATGEQVRLDSVATVERTANPVQLTRIDGQRANTVSATPKGDDTGGASTAVNAALAKVDLPSGVTYSLGGITASQGDAFAQLGLAILAAIALVLLILLAVFKSFRQTVILLVSVPFAFTGAVFLLGATGTPLGVAALIGVLMLIGIVVTNAIVLMDLVNQYRHRGMSVLEAVVEGGSRRLRPILMTALATMIALVPMALGITGSGGIISKPLAIVVIGGLFTSTLLTLVLIPVLYASVEARAERRSRRREEQRPTATRDEHIAPSPEPAAPVLTS